MADMFSGFVLLEQFSRIFSVLLVLVIVYAVLQWARVLGSNKGIHAFIAIAIAMLFGVSESAIQVINFITPWFVILFFFILFIITSIKIFGATDADVIGVLKSSKYAWIIYWIVAAAIVIFAFGLSNVFGQSLLGGEGAPAGNAGGTTQGGAVAVDANGNVVDPGAGVGSDDFDSNLMNTIFHPNILGLLLILLIASFAVRALAVG